MIRIEKQLGGDCWFCGAGMLKEPRDNRWGYVYRIQRCPIWCVRRIIDYVTCKRAGIRVEWGPWNVTRRLA